MQEIKSYYEQLSKAAKKESVYFKKQENFVDFYLKFRNKSSKLLMPIVKCRSR